MRSYNFSVAICQWCQPASIMYSLWQQKKVFLEVRDNRPLGILINSSWQVFCAMLFAPICLFSQVCSDALQIHTVPAVLALTVSLNYLLLRMFLSWKLAHSSSVWLSSLSPFSFSLCFALYFLTVRLFPPPDFLLLLSFAFLWRWPSHRARGKMSAARCQAGTAESDKETSGELTVGEHMYSSVNWGNISRHTQVQLCPPLGNADGINMTCAFS